MNSVRFVQQYTQIPLEYTETDRRLDGKVARAFHKNLMVEKYTSAASAASAATAAIPLVNFNTPLTPFATAESIASGYPLAVESKKIMVDNQMVMVYWKNALEVPFGKRQSMQVRAIVESAISELANVFFPPRPTF